MFGKSGATRRDRTGDLLITNQPAGSYVKAIRFGQQELPEQILDLSPGSAGELRVVLRFGAAEVAGTVHDAQGNAATDPLTVLLIPDNASPDATQSGSTNQTGGFSIKNIPPGRYHAIALDAQEQMNLRDATLLKQLSGKASDVEVKENGNQQIQLTVLPADDLKRAAAAAGLEN